MDLAELIKEFVPANEQEKSDKEASLKYINDFDDILTHEKRQVYYITFAYIGSVSEMKEIFTNAK